MRYSLRIYCAEQLNDIYLLSNNDVAKTMVSRLQSMNGKVESGQAVDLDHLDRDLFKAVLHSSLLPFYAAFHLL